jgi:tRNA threonylcarbamoyladenosine biosynthesis protein TsaE
MIEVELLDADATERLGAVIAEVMSAADVVLLIGDLGAGKTTLVRGLVAGLGGTDQVTSPTFTLRHEYDTDPPLTHVDCWRLGSIDELDDLGLDEVLTDGGAVAIEWGTLAKPFFGSDALLLTLSDIDGGARRLARLDFRSARWEAREMSIVAALSGAAFPFVAHPSDSSAR